MYFTFWRLVLKLEQAGWRFAGFLSRHRPWERR